jgi:hypothetical protein
MMEINARLNNPHANIADHRGQSNSATANNWKNLPDVETGGNLAILVYVILFAFVKAVQVCDVL